MIEYDKDAIVPPYITEYLREKTVHNDALLHELEAYAKENSVPIVEPETARFLSVMTEIKKPLRILEIGCAIGYSAILMSKGLADGGKITTIEYNNDMVNIARKNIGKAGLSDTITVIEADAKDYLAYIDDDEVFDIIFLDGPKAHYIYMLDDCVRLLKKGGIIISDNVLYKGMIADDNHVVRRKITIVKRLRKYIDALMEHEKLKTALLPLGDGVTVSVKI
ncbi:MAG: O-methyltransferase [Oscillospiraceae bacterium]|nr:O-methyltransferase [Oscillospiraceae bacterium]